MLARGFIKPADEEPDIDGFYFYVDAFRELSTSRPVGMELGAIPFTAIYEYSRIYRLDENEFEDFAHVMRQMDNVFLEMNAKVQASEEKKNATSKPN